MSGSGKSQAVWVISGSVLAVVGFFILVMGLLQLVLPGLFLLGIGADASFLPGAASENIEWAYMLVGVALVVAGLTPAIIGAAREARPADPPPPGQRSPARVFAVIGVVGLVVVLSSVVVVHRLFTPTFADWYVTDAADEYSSELTVAARVPCSARVSDVRTSWTFGLHVQVLLAPDGLVPWQVPLIGSTCDHRVPGKPYEYETVVLRLQQPVGPQLSGCGTHAEVPGCASPTEPPTGGWPSPSATVTDR